MWSDKNGTRIKLKPFENNQQYLRVDLYNDGQRTRYFVHRLTCLIWNGPPSNKKRKQVNHKDRDKRNNHRNNLEWVTNKENKAHDLATRPDAKPDVYCPF